MIRVVMKHASKDINLHLILSKKLKSVSEIMLVVFPIISFGVNYMQSFIQCIIEKKSWGYVFVIGREKREANTLGFEMGTKCSWKIRQET